jgi:hypothetical protein
VARVVMSVKAAGEIEDAVHDFLDDVLGPLITQDAVRYAPIRTGELKGSIRYWVDALTLRVGAFAPYAADVELGHRVFHRFKHVVGPEIVPEEPYLRPAVYKYRSPEDPEGTPPLIPPGVARPPKAFAFESFTQWYRDKYGKFTGGSYRSPLRMEVGPSLYSSRSQR